MTRLAYAAIAVLAALLLVLFFGPCDRQSAVGAETPALSGAGREGEYDHHRH